MIASNDERKRRAASLSVITNVGLTVAKIGAAVVTGSVSLFSEAIHSATDVVASSLAYASVKVSSVPPDEDHPYGHGKVESLAGFGEAVMLLLIVAYVVFEAIGRLLHPTDIDNIHLGLWVMGMGALASLAVGVYVSAIGRQTSSLALRSNGQHLIVDFVTSVGVFGALTVTHFTGWRQADSVFALIFAAWIARGAWMMGRESFEQLIDRRISNDDLERLEAILKSEERVMSYHRLRTRQSGETKFVDLHVVVPREWSVVQAHDLADSLEKQIRDVLRPAHVVIHVDPFDPRKIA